VTGKTSYSYADVGGFSVPAALGNDITTITGFEQWAQAQDPGRILSTPRTNATPASTDRATAVTRPADATSGFRCSQYWGQYTTPIPAAFGHTSAPTELCGYTVSQLRSAYGISSSPYTGKGATIAVVLDGYSPTMLADANQFFAGQGVPGFAPGQYTEDFGGDNESAGALGASCDNEPDQPEEALDVETAHIAAPDAHVVYMGTDCAGDVEGPMTQHDADGSVPALRTDRLGRRYGKAWGLRDCTLEVSAGAVAALVGPNGAGKTTLLEMIIGLLEPTEGQVSVFGEASRADTAETLARVGYVAQDHPLYRDFSVADMFHLGRAMNPGWDQELAASRVDALGIPLNRKVKSLSGGQRAQVSLTMALAKRAPLVVLDEPVSSLDPVARLEFMRDVMALAADTTLTFLISSHVISDWNGSATG
jgi:ABC-type cobalamin/Fe3+-siderophores transport system ATPase subunit